MMGRKQYNKNKELLDEIGQHFGVDPCFIVSFWGMESSYGQFMGEQSVIRSLATLAYEGRRRQLFADEFIALLKARPVAGDLDLGEEYVGYQVNAPINVPGITHINGWEFNINAPLATFTNQPVARFFRVFANTTLVTNRSPAEADFRGFTPKMINWGFNYNRRGASLMAKWTLVGKKRVGTIAAGNIGANGWNYQAERLRLDLSGDYRLNARYGLYFTARNIFNDRDQNYAYAIGSPRYVKFSGEGEYGVNFQVGIKGNF